jgi:hypothetical protein
LYAATLTVKIEDIRDIDGKEFIHTEYETLFNGAVTENEEEVFLNRGENPSPPGAICDPYLYR